MSYVKLMDNKQVLVRNKLKRSGPVLTFYRYKEPISLVKHYDEPKQKSYIDGISEKYPKESSKLSSASRAKTRLMDYINTNCYQYKDRKGRVIKPIFLTLTFKDNLTDITKANKLFTDFVKRLNYSLLGEKNSKLLYVNIIEFQKRGAVHYHCIFFNLNYIPKDKIQKLWNKGFIDIHNIKEADDIGMYVTKYLSKNFQDNRYKGKKSYFISKGLLKPDIIFEQNIINKAWAICYGSLPVYIKDDFDINGVVKVDITKYNLKNEPVKLKDIIEHIKRLE